MQKGSVFPEKSKPLISEPATTCIRAETIKTRENAISAQEVVIQTLENRSENLLCKVCLQNDSNIIVSPCFHRAMCLFLTIVLYVGLRSLIQLLYTSLKFLVIMQLMLKHPHACVPMVTAYESIVCI